MRTTQSVVDNLLKNSTIVKGKRLSRAELETLIQDYQESVFQVLLDNGYVRLSEDMKIHLVKLKDRQYVLRGNSYMNHRKYKLKMVTSSNVYTKIEDAYNILM